MVIFINSKKSYPQKGTHIFHKFHLALNPWSFHCTKANPMLQQYLLISWNTEEKSINITDNKQSVHREISFN